MMSGQLSITSVELTRLAVARQAFLPPDLCGEPANFALAVSVTNHCPDTTMYATATVTHVEFGSGVLQVRFRSPDLLDERRPYVAEHRAVAPGATAVLESVIASPITFAEADGRSLRYVFVDRDVDRIECSVTYTDSRPPASVNLAARVPAVDRMWHTAEMGCRAG